MIPCTVLFPDRSISSQKSFHEWAFFTRSKGETVAATIFFLQTSHCLGSDFRDRGRVVIGEMPSWRPINSPLCLSSFSFPSCCCSISCAPHPRPCDLGRRSSSVLLDLILCHREHIVLFPNVIKGSLPLLMKLRVHFHGKKPPIRLKSLRWESSQENDT